MYPMLSASFLCKTTANIPYFCRYRQVLSAKLPVLAQNRLFLARGIGGVLLVIQDCDMISQTSVRSTYPTGFAKAVPP